MTDPDRALTVLCPACDWRARASLTVAFTACSLRYVTAQQEAEAALSRWASQRRESDSARDDLIRAALAAGTTKHRIHVLTGIARTTIDSILDKEQ